MIDNLLLLIPALPLLSALILLLLPLTKPLVTFLALTSTGLTAAAVLWIQLNTNTDFASMHFIYWQWLAVDSLQLNVAFTLDALSLMMISIISGVGWLIHLFSVSFMRDDIDYRRYFAYLNLFVAAMLILVLSDNLLLLYLGWEGVGLCSYLLIGFWHQDRGNNIAANKAFMMTRLGDTAMLIGLVLLFWQFGSLDIASINQQATSDAINNSSLINLTCLLLFVGAAGKSAQFPLHSWLPDAMAGPTPVSALIHAATMVTAGIYLIARMLPLFNNASDTLQLIAIVGTITLLLGATAAMVQTDLKKILAYSTISQLGYMFLALGVGATSAASFHLMTHAFFKALLFLSAGALIHCLDHQHNIFKMGGLMRKMPLVAGAFFVGCAALSSLPLLSGFFSKELILSQVIAQGHQWLWIGALFGAFCTAFYCARLVLVIFFGPLAQSPSKPLPLIMSIVLSCLILLSLFGGFMPSSIDLQFPAPPANLSALQHYLPIILPFVAFTAAFYCWKTGVFRKKLKSTLDRQAHKVLLSGWHIDLLYQTLFVQPFFTLTRWLKTDIVDQCYRAIERMMIALHSLASKTQNGSLRFYSASIIIFIICALAWLMLAGQSL